MANRDEVVTALKETLVERLKVDASTITEEANLFEDLGLDSIDLMTVVMAVEEKFSIEVSDEELEDVTTLGQAADLLSAKVGTNA
ncbi:MAG TPA: acyl carrier protein [Actinomycetota bacterium]|jgi:acyl carrier protein|nr:acyl carrier protein [Actinomycetota bacterium]